MIGQGLDYQSLQSSGDPPPPMLYWVTVLKDDKQEAYQKEFYRLSDALESINSKYGHWEFVDTSLAQSEGCDSCSNSNHSS